MENICKVHNVEMEKKELRIGYGTPSRWYMEYCCEIKDKLFPNCDDPVDGGCFVREEKSMQNYVCEACNKKRDEWNKNNLKTWKKEHGR
jgi:hypothetical protein